MSYLPSQPQLEGATYQVSMASNAEDGTTEGLLFGQVTLVYNSEHNQGTLAEGEAAADGMFQRLLDLLDGSEFRLGMATKSLKLNSEVTVTPEE